MSGEYEPESKIKKNILFIFDDLERVANELSYISLLGLFNQLLLNGCKIICLSSLSDVSKTESNRINDISYFIEKSFDRIYHIDEDPSEVIKIILADAKLDEKLVETCIPMFRKNLRTTIKVKDLLIDIKNNEEKYNYSPEKKYTQLQVLKACIVATKSIYIGLEDNNKNGEEDMRSKVNYSSGELKKRVEKWLNHDFLMINSEEKENVKTLAVALCKVMLYDDYHDLSSLCPSKINDSKQNEEDMRTTSVYYLNDDDRKIYFNEFKEKTASGYLKINRNYVDRLIELVKYTKFDLSKDNFIDLVTDKIAESAIHGEEEALNRLHDYVEFPLETGDPERVKEIYKATESKVKDVRIKEFEKEIGLYCKNKDYASLTYVIYDIENKRTEKYIKDYFNKLLTENNFYLPDLSKSIGPNEWSYCHEVSKYSFKNDYLIKPLTDYLKNIIKKHSTKPATIDKAFSLVKYNCNDPVILKEFNEYMESLNK